MRILLPGYAAVNKVTALSTKRIFVGIIAIYAVFLQRAAICAIEASAFDLSGGITCLQDKRSPSAPTNDFRRHHARAASWLALPHALLELQPRTPRLFPRARLLLPLPLRQRARVACGQ
jgi:hypothetical protein